MCRQSVLLFSLLFSTLSFAQSWATEVVPDTLPDYGFYHGAALDANGNLYIAYSAVTSTKHNAPSVVRFVTRSAAGVWSAPVTIDTLGATAISLAIDQAGNPAVTESQGALHYIYQNPTTHAWTIETVENSAANDVTSLVFDPSNLATITYRTCTNKGGGTKFARRTGANTWTKQLIDKSCGGRYTSLAYDLAGNPGVAYSDDCSGVGDLNCLKYAHFDGISWTAAIVEQGTTGYGTFASLAFDASNNPAIAHHDLGVRYLTSSAGVFNLVQWVNGPSGYGQGEELHFDPQNDPHIAFQDGSSVFLTDQFSGWVNTTVETGAPRFIINDRSFNGATYILLYDALQKKLVLVHQ